MFKAVLRTGMLQRVLLFTIGALILCLPNSAQADFRKIKVAVLDFQQNGKFETPDVGKMVAEWFTTALVETGRFDIIERRLLQQIVDEQKISVSGIIEPGSASRLGKVLGVKTVVTGTVQSFDGRLEINARVINVETGSIIAAEKVQADSTARLTDLVRLISVKVVRAFPLEGYVVQRTKDRVIIDLGRQAGVQPGMHFSVYTEGKAIKHPITGEILDIEKIENGVVEVREVREKTSHGRITEETAPEAIKSRQLVRVYRPQDQLAEPDLLPDAAPQPLRVPLPVPVSKPLPVTKPGPALQQGALPQSFVLSEHTDDIKALAFSRSGRLAASADQDHVIILWDARSWKALATLRGHKSEVKTVRFSSDERYLASGSGDESVIVWDVQQKGEVRNFKVGKSVNAVAFSPDGTLLATGVNSKSIFLWDLQSGAKVATFTAKDNVFDLAFSPDGKVLATGGNNHWLQLWDVASGTLIRNLVGHKRDIRVVTFNKAGNLLITAGDDKKIICWDIATGNQVKVLEGHRNSVRSLGVSADGSRLVSGDGRKEGGIIVWNLQSGQEIARVDSERDFERLALSPDGCTVLLGCDKNLVVRGIK
jgi:WD40 repeat protein/TolB-like protein